MDLENIDDERLLKIVQQELDRRTKEKQQRCPHRRSGTIIANGIVECDQCGKVMDQNDLDNAYEGEVAVTQGAQSTVERRGLRQAKAQ